MTSTLPTPQFLFVSCQRGAEGALKSELARIQPELRLAFSRPGFLTFKRATNSDLPPDFDLGSVFARAFGISIGKTIAASQDERVAETLRLIEPLTASGIRFDRLHIWPRIETPYPSTSCDEARVALAAAAQRPDWADEPEPRTGDWGLDVVQVEPDQWWIGYHQHNPAHLPWPGGLSRKPLPEHAVSRAYLKLDQALDWSRLPVRLGQIACELGSSPGGAAQALLDRGLYVLGIDPAPMHPDVLASPNFEHLQRRSPAVPRKVYRKPHWLMADMNVAPDYTLTAAEDIVTRPETRFRGLILTLKLTDWSLADQLPAYLDRIRGWGFESVFARQLQHHRQEIAVAALRS